MHVTHLWELPDHVIRVGVARRKDGFYYTFAAFKEPERGAPDAPATPEPKAPPLTVVP